MARPFPWKAAASVNLVSEYTYFTAWSPSKIRSCFLNVRNEKKSALDMVGPVGFEPTTSAESFVYGYLHALLNFVIPPTGGLLTRCSIFWSPSSFLSRTHF